MELILWLILATLVVGLAVIGFIVNTISSQLAYIGSQNETIGHTIIKIDERLERKFVHGQG